MIKPLAFDMLKKDWYFMRIVNKLFTRYMQLFNGNIEEIVLSSLFHEGSLSVAALSTLIKKKRGVFTKQGLYRVLRKLKTEEKVVIYKGVISLNQLWVFTLRSLTQKASGGNSVIGNIAEMKEGERIQLRLKGLDSIDRVWSDLFLSLEMFTPASLPLYLYNPHNWTILAREATDRVHIEQLEKKGRQTFLAIGSDTFLDKETVKLMKSKHVECSIYAGMNEDTYIAVLGVFIFHIKFDAHTNLAVDHAFRESETIDELKEKLRQLDTKAKGKIMVERETGKALAWKKKFAKHFYIRKELRE